MVALVASVSAIQVGKGFYGDSQTACEYHKSEDGESCIPIQMPCDVEASSPPKYMKDCPDRHPGSARTDDPSKSLPMSNWKTPNKIIQE